MNRLLQYQKRLRDDMRKRGMGMTVIIGAIAVLSLFTGAIMSVTVKTLHAMSDGEKTDRARYAAQSGIQSALNRLNTPGGAAWAHAHPTYPGPFSVQANEPIAEAWEDAMLISFADHPDVKAVVTVYNNTGFCPPAFRNTQAPDGSDIPEGHIYICSSGIIQGQKKVQLSTVGALVSAKGFSFDRALFGNNKVQVDSGLIDSFNSNHARSTPPPTGLPPMVSTTSNADLEYYYESYFTGSSSPETKAASIGSNKATPGAVTLGTGTGSPNAALVDGDIYTGIGGGAPAITAGSDAFYSGDEPTATKDMPQTFAPSPEPPAAYVQESDFVQSGGTLDLEGGQTYYYKGHLRLDNVRINVTGTGPVTIYAAKDVEITNDSAVNWGKKPDRLQLYMIDDGAGQATISDSRGAFVLAGSNSKVSIQGNSEVFGSVLADEVVMKDAAKLHYDSALAGVMLGRTDFDTTNTFGGSTSTSASAIVVAGQTALAPPPAPAPAPGPGPAPAPAPAPAPGPGGTGCGGCGCLMEAVQCL